MSFKIEDHLGISKRLVIPPRGRFIRKLLIGSDWSEIKIGMFAAMYNTTGSQTNESVAVSDNRSNIFCYGLTTGDLINDPENANAIFRGSKSRNQTRHQGTSSLRLGDNTDSATRGWAYTSIPDGSLSISQYPTYTRSSLFHWNAPPINDIESPNNFASFIGFRVMVLNKGTALQALRVWCNTDGSNNIVSDTSRNNLEIALNKTNWQIETDFEWLKNGEPASLPNSFILRNPFWNHGFYIYSIIVQGIK